MKTRALAFAASLYLVACGQEGQDSQSLEALRPSPSSEAVRAAVIQDQDAKTFIEILKRSGVQEQSSIETTFLNVTDAFCVSGTNPSTHQSIKICQFSVGGGLFVRANTADSDTFIKLIRKNGAVSKVVTNGKRWDLKDFECSTRFDLSTRKLVSSCSFRQ